MAIRDGINALLTLMALVVVVPFVLVAAALFMVWDMCFGRADPGDDAWEWADYE